MSYKMLIGKKPWGRSKETFAYLYKTCHMLGYSKKLGSGRNQSGMKKTRINKKFENTGEHISNDEIMEMIKEFRNNEMELKGTEEEVRCSTYRHIKCMNRSRDLITLQQKLCNKFFHYQIAQNLRILHAVDTVNTVHNNNPW